MQYVFLRILWNAVCVGCSARLCLFIAEDRWGLRVQPGGIALCGVGIGAALEGCSREV